VSPILGVFASAQQSAFVVGDYESIATTTVGAGGSSTITFSSIPSTYTHLQIRAIARTNRTAGVDIMSTRMNGVTSNSYSDHLLYGDGTTVQTDRNSTYGTINIQRVASDNLSASIFSIFTIDILDYANTNKYKTVRYMGGYDANGSGRACFGSGLFQNTSAITSITLESAYSSSYNQYSQFALYGIKG